MTLLLTKSATPISFLLYTLMKPHTTYILKWSPMARLPTLIRLWIVSLKICPPNLTTSSSYSSHTTINNKKSQPRGKLARPYFYIRKVIPSSLLPNNRSIALANTIYKLFTNTFTSLLLAYGEKTSNTIYQPRRILTEMMY